MRPDVKLGVVSSMVFVLVAGMYFLYRERQEQSILVAEGLGSAAGPLGADQRSRATEKPITRQRPAVFPTQKRVRGSRAPHRSGQSTLAQRRTGAAKSVPSKTGSAIKPPRIADAASTSNTKPVARKAVRQPAARNPSRQTRRSPGLTGAVAQLDAPAVGLKNAERTRPGSIRKGTPLTASRRPSAVNRIADAAVETHRVQSGDTLTALSERYYGSTKYMQFLIKSNPNIANPDRLKVGMIVRIPPRPADKALLGSQARRVIKGSSGRSLSKNDARTYRVKSGDSFYVIARDVLGDSARWKELFELNRGAVHGDPTRLQAGQVITLPSK